MNKNSTVKMGNFSLVRTGAVGPLKALTQRQPMTSAVDAACKTFAEHQAGWVKVEREPGL